MKNLWKEKVLSGAKTIGTFIASGDASTAEAAAISNIDYAIIDTEHGPFDVESTANMIRSFELHNSTALVRVKDSHRNSILKMLDVGAKGLVIPQIHSVEQVKEIISYGKYYPLGDRGFAFGRGASYGRSPYVKQGMSSYMEFCNRESLLIPQCETLGSLEKIDEIAALKGVDGVFIGPYDLSIALGIPGQFEDSRFKNALTRIREACEKAGKFCVVFCSNATGAKQRMKEGFKHVTVSTDYSFYINALNAAVDEIMG